MAATNPTIQAALALLQRAFDGEYRYALACLEIHEAALTNPGSWDGEQNRVRDQELRKLLAVPAIPGKFLLNPGCNLSGPSPWPEQNVRISKKRLTRREVLKASCYTHPEHEFVVRCLANKATPAKPSNLMLQRRYDVVVRGGEARLANASQRVCVTCKGTSGLPAHPPCSRVPEPCVAGYVHPPTFDLGELGELVAVYRSERIPTKYQVLFDAEV